MRIFEPALNLLQRLPANTPAGLVLRHSTRFPILTNDQVYLAGLTPEGFEQAEALGSELARLRPLGRLMASPVVRCIDTASSIAKGAGWQAIPAIEYRLSHPHIEPVWSTLSLRRFEKTMPVPVRAVLDLVLNGQNESDLDVFVTHDTIVASLAGYFLGHAFHYPDYWPDYLEGVLIWRIDKEIFLGWRNDVKVIASWPLETSHQLSLKF